MLENLGSKIFRMKSINQTITDENKSILAGRSIIAASISK